MNNPFVVFLNTNGVLLLIAIVLLQLFFSRNNKEVFWHALFVFVTTAVVTAVLKELFARPRPFEEFGHEPMAGLTWLSSFPSAHASLSFAVSTTVSLHKRRIGLFLLIISCLIAIGRVAAGVHYVSDIVFGILIGVLVALFFDTIHFKKHRQKKRG